MGVRPSINHWNRYWNPDDPKVENDRRDVLADWLKTMRLSCTDVVLIRIALP